MTPSPTPRAARQAPPPSSTQTTLGQALGRLILALYQTQREQQAHARRAA